MENSRAVPTNIAQSRYRELRAWRHRVGVGLGSSLQISLRQNPGQASNRRNGKPTDAYSAVSKYKRLKGALSRF